MSRQPYVFGGRIHPLHISSQKEYLEEFAARNGFTNVVHRTDDGWSGTRWDRPGFLQIIEDIERSNVSQFPPFRSSFHWVLTVVSDRFPDDTFELRYGRYGSGDGKTWHWTDNYYNLLFRDEPAAICTEFAEEFFGVDCIAKAPIFQEGWLDGVGENSTFQEWTQAGGRITDVTIWFCDFLPEDDEFIAFADALTEKLPIVGFIKCRGLTSEGYQAVSTQQDVLDTIWNEHREWIIGRIDFSPKSREIVLSQRYFTD